MTRTESERLVKLETEFEHMAAKVDHMAKQVEEMHSLLLQAKGARWAVLGMATIGGFLSAKIGALIPWIGMAPK